MESYCGGLTLASFQVPTEVLCHSPSSTGQGERKYAERLVGWDKDREATQQLLSRAEETQIGEINLIYCQLTPEQDNKK